METLETRKAVGSKFDEGHPLLDAWIAIQDSEPKHHQAALAGKLGPDAQKSAQEFEAKLHSAFKAWREA